MNLDYKTIFINTFEMKNLWEMEAAYNLLGGKPYDETLTFKNITSIFFIMFKPGDFSPEKNLFNINEIKEKCIKYNKFAFYIDIEDSGYYNALLFNINLLNDPDFQPIKKSLISRGFKELNVL